MKILRTPLFFGLIVILNIVTIRAHAQNDHRDFIECTLEPSTSIAIYAFGERKEIINYFSDSDRKSAFDKCKDSASNLVYIQIHRPGSRKYDNGDTREGLGENNYSLKDGTNGKVYGAKLFRDDLITQAVALVSNATKESSRWLNKNAPVQPPMDNGYSRKPILMVGVGLINPEEVDLLCDYVGDDYWVSPIGTLFGGMPSWVINLVTPDNPNGTLMHSDGGNSEAECVAKRKALLKPVYSALKSHHYLEYKDRSNKLTYGYFSVSKITY